MPVFDRSIKLGLEFSDTPAIRIDEFNSLLQGLDILNNLSVSIYNDEVNIPENINELRANNSRVRIGNDRLSKIAAINKNSPLRIEMEFGSIGAFIVITNLANRIPTWEKNYSLDQVIEELQKLDFDFPEHYTSTIERSQIVFDELNDGRNRGVLNLIAASFNNNSVKLIGVRILEEHFA